jgi:hypothetical protein
MTKPWIPLLALLLAACGQSGQAPPRPQPAPAETTETAQPPALPPVAEELTAAPNTAFVAMEPSEFGVFGAPTILEALAGLLASTESGEGEVQLSVREGAEDAVADIVRVGLQDDAVSAAHIRIEFRREPEGWFPVNAYRRQQCARGPLAGQWSNRPCP